MANSYKTPGVYVEEISKFPPSVAGVETAIPAFIGYTEIAPKAKLNDPRRITSLLEYETIFGRGPKLSIETVGTSKTIKNVEFVLYDSIRLFYDNGGGVCYIVSVDQYEKTAPTIIAPDFEGGIEELEKYDEVTLVLFPDAASLDTDQLALIQNKALEHCMREGDRFAILDVKKYNSTEKDDIQIFRDKISNDELELRYGAAYYPYLSTSYTKSFTFEDVKKYTDDFAVAITQMSADTLAQLNSIITDLGKRILTPAQKAAIAAITLDDDEKTKSDEEQAVLLQAKKDAKRAEFEEAFIDTKIEKITLSDEEKTKPIGEQETLLLEKQNQERERLKAEGITLTPAQETTISGIKLTVVEKTKSTDEQTALVKQKQDAKRAEFEAANKLSSDQITEINKIKLTDEEKSGLDAAAQAALLLKKKAKKQAEFEVENNTKLNLRINSIIPFIPGYAETVKYLSALATLIPPSGAIAGIMCATDLYKGVWQAPANVSIASISGLSDLITDKTQENMNIDSNGGKSINAIRSFSGKGILVWGARTLDGNSNEWRYIPVRRLFNYIEESIQKSTSWAVFSPNDGNTWVKVKCQIENFLNNLWRIGALAGSKPESAYFVKVGLGVTMEYIDIQEGKLIIEVGLAAVRPAEFIILRFSHKVQE